MTEEAAGRQVWKQPTLSDMSWNSEEAAAELWILMGIISSASSV